MNACEAECIIVYGCQLLAANPYTRTVATPAAAKTAAAVVRVVRVVRVCQPSERKPADRGGTRLVF